MRHRSRSVILTAILATGCAQDVVSSTDGDAAASQPRRTVRTAATAPAAGPACTATGAHDQHAARGFGCETCHACAGQYAFSTAYQLPSGASIASGQIVRTTTGATCLVACHSPFGAPPAPVSWNQGGPLACTACHVQQGLPPAATMASSHAADMHDAGSIRDTCQYCHDVSRHMSGVIRVLSGDGTLAELAPGDSAQADAVCRSCHDGMGSLLGGHTPPVLNGWDSALGDWHGTRAGPVFGTTLAAGFVTGQGPLPCTSCHTAHPSANAFLLAGTVNGLPLAGGTVARNGVGAQTFCAACHLGTRHQACINCHTTTLLPLDPMAVGAGWDPSAPHVDPAPAGSPCFWCHGHEGVLHISIPATSVTLPQNSSWTCNHCHDTEPVPPPDLVAPTFTDGIAVAPITATAATVNWTTNEVATSFVEWGLQAPDHTTGAYRPLSTAHSVALPALSPATTYVFRVRSWDGQRNLSTSALQSFTTAALHAPSQPVLNAVRSQAAAQIQWPIHFSWSASTAESGHAVQYRVLASHSADLAQPVMDSGWIDATSFDFNLPPGSTDATARYSWSVAALDTVNGITSPWAAPGTFTLRQY